MDKQHKAQFIKQCLDSTRDALLAKLERVPENWDGHELRAWIVQDVAFQLGSSVIPQQLELKGLREPRVKAFRAAVITHNL